MSQRLTPVTALLLLVPPLMWAGNAVVGRMAYPLVPPATLNLLRWITAFVMLLPLAAWVLRPGSGLWTHWRRYAVLGLLSVGCYNTLLYLALRTSTPINVTLVSASMPIFMLAIGRIGFGQAITRRQVLGALMSVAGVVLVMCRGDWALLRSFHLVPGDLYVLFAVLCWSLYSWLLTRPGDEPAALRGDWAAHLMAQVVLGLGWSLLFAAGEWAFVDGLQVQWGWPLAAALIYVGLGASVLAYRCWGVGVQRAGPTIAGFFSNLMPLFAALLSTLLLGEAPRLYHGVAFVLIVGGIVVSSRR